MDGNRNNQSASGANSMQRGVSFVDTMSEAESVLDTEIDNSLMSSQSGFQTARLSSAVQETATDPPRRGVVPEDSHRQVHPSETRVHAGVDRGPLFNDYDLTDDAANNETAVKVHSLCTSGQRVQQNRSVPEETVPVVIQSQKSLLTITTTPTSGSQISPGRSVGSPEVASSSDAQACSARFQSRTGDEAPPEPASASNNACTSEAAAARHEHFIPEQTTDETCVADWSDDIFNILNKAMDNDLPKNWKAFMCLHRFKGREIHIFAQNHPKNRMTHILLDFEGFHNYTIGKLKADLKKMGLDNVVKKVEEKVNYLNSQQNQ